MDKRQILILLQIGPVNVSHKCVKSVSVDRNFSDVGDKFSIDIIDTPDTNISYDLELYMAAGYRQITLKYGDLTGETEENGIYSDNLVSFKGTIWDYTNSFVGNMKVLTVTGIMNRYSHSRVGAAEYTYNIDWNNYFSKRDDEKDMYGAMKALLVNEKLTSKYYEDKLEQEETGVGTNEFLSSAILNAEYRDAITSNTNPGLFIDGPVGTINLPIPDSFIPLEGADLPDNIVEEYSKIMDGTDNDVYKKFKRVVKDTNHEFWGQLTLSTSPIENIANQTMLFQGISPYLAEKFYIRNYEKGDDWDEATQRITNISMEVITDSHAIVFPSDVVTNSNNKYIGWKAASRYFVQEKWLYYLTLLSDFDDCWNFVTGSTNSENQKNWFNGGNLSSYSNFYKKITQDDWEVFTPNEKTMIRYVRNNYGQIIAFNVYRFKTNNKNSETFVAIKEREFNYLLAKNYGTAPKHPDSDDYCAFNTGYLSTVAWYKYAGYTAAIYSGIEKTGNYYFYDDDGYLRGFYVANKSGNHIYIQANMQAEKSIYGAAGILNSGVGVDISSIVKKLCILEGWSFDDTTIAQTELIPNNDAFIMQGQTAIDFILNNLVPKAITPLGKYTVIDENGNKVQRIIDKPMGGFYPFFDKNGKFHFQPLTEENIDTLNIPNLGYNIPNSPVLSFQINTKGTAFYINRIIDYSPMSLVTGEQVTDIEVASDSIAESIEQTRGHNDTFDAWLGLTYQDVESATQKYESGWEKYDMALHMARNALVTKPSSFILGSAELDDSTIKSRVKEAEDKIEKATIKATLSMWGNTKVCPARNITVTNMLKGGSDYLSIPKRHPSSGKYLILSMQDRISDAGYIQNLNLLRYSADVAKSINPYKIDYTKTPEYTIEPYPKEQSTDENTVTTETPLC